MPVSELRSIDYFQFRSAFLVNVDFEFTDIADFIDQDTWIQAIKDRYIIPLLGAKQVSDKSDDTNYQTSKLEYKYKAYENKYEFDLSYLAPLDYIKVINQLDSQLYSIIFVDANNYVYAYSPDGTKIKALDTTLISFNKPKMGEASPSYTVMKVEIENPAQITELGIIQKFEWNVNRLEIIFVSITAISGTTSSISFTVKDENYDCPIRGLTETEITLDDNSGAETIGGLIEGNPGVYQLASITPGLTFGNIVINSNTYYGVEGYVITGAAVSVSYITYTSATELIFNVINDFDSSLVGGLLIGDFTITDDINGVLSIGAFSEISTGRYNLSSLSDNMTTGDIDISNGVYTGSDPYDLDILVTISNFTNSSTTEISLSVVELISGNNVTTLGNADWVILDDYSSVIAVTNTSYSLGLYTLTLDSTITTGSLSVLTSIYSGIASYDYEQEFFRNGGASGTTDWINPTGGLAEFWIQQSPSLKEASIETGNGFTGNYQEAISLSGDASGALLLANAIFFRPGETYKLAFDFRTDSTISIIVFAPSGTLLSESTTTNIGNAISFLSSSFSAISTDTFLQVLFSASKSVSTEQRYINIDNVRLIEQ